MSKSLQKEKTQNGFSSGNAKITVYNLKNSQIADIVYAGRRFAGREGSPLGNRFKTSEHTAAAHKTVVDKYKAWLWREIQADNESVRAELRRLKQLAEQGNLNIGCWCKPLPCHADVIKACIEWAIRESFEF